VATILIDTNLMVYAFDRKEFSKQAQAITTLQVLQASGQGRISVQALAEFFRATTRLPQPMLNEAEAAEQAERFTRTFLILELTPLIVLEAMRGVRVHRLAYWDAQIWATARLNQIPIIFSEDFNTGATLEGVSFVNPFTSDFVIEAWA
jgi:predicted nucleic acid-binding protein